MPQPAARAVQPVPQQQSDPYQPYIQLFAVLDRYKGVPPGRALWRELVEIVLTRLGSFPGVGKKIRVAGQIPVSASDVRLVAWELYARADKSGVVNGFTVNWIAKDCRLHERIVRQALKLLESGGALRRERPNPRRPAVYHLNAGGLDWPTLKNRVREYRNVQFVRHRCPD